MPQQPQQPRPSSPQQTRQQPSSGFEFLSAEPRAGDATAQPGKGTVGNGMPSEQQPIPLPSDSPPNFWHEFLRVQSDKLILAGLGVFLILRHADDKLIAGVIGALTVLIQGQRFRLGNIGRK